MLEVSERTIYRDVAELVSPGAPIEGESGVGYVLRPGLFLPPLMLNNDEIEAIGLGVRYVDQRGDGVLTSAAASALAKIASILSPHARSMAIGIPPDASTSSVASRTPIRTAKAETQTPNRN